MSAIQQLIAGTSGGPVIGQVVYDTPGLTSWVCPAGVTSVSVVVVGFPDGGKAGALAYKNNITVVPGNSYDVSISNSSARSYFIGTGTVSAGAGTNRTGDGGGSGNGGAGGYSGDGGDFSGFSPGSPGLAGTGGAGGSGAYDDNGVNSAVGGGGGVGLLGQGANGAGGTAVAGSRVSTGGGGGSGGVSGATSTSSVGGAGGAYGGRPGQSTTGTPINGAPGKSGLRIIWPGNTRSFPSTNTANM